MDEKGPPFESPADLTTVPRRFGPGSMSDSGGWTAVVPAFRQRFPLMQQTKMVPKRIIAPNAAPEAIQGRLLTGARPFAMPSSVLFVTTAQQGSAFPAPPQ